MRTFPGHPDSQYYPPLSPDRYPRSHRCGLSIGSFVRTSLALLLASVLGHAATDLGRVHPESWPNLNGVPSYRFYQPETIGTQSGINAFTLDPFGRLLLTSGPQLVIFDGSAWTTLRPEDGTDDPPGNLYACLAAPSGRLLCSSDKGLFAIEFLADNRFRLHPLVDATANENTDLHSLRHGELVGDTVYFYGQSSVFRYDERENLLTKLPALERTIASVALRPDRNYFFAVEGENLVEEQNRWDALPEFGVTHSRAVVRENTFWAPKGIVLAPDGGGLFTLHDRDIEPWPTEIDTFVTTRVRAMAPISDAYLAVAVQAEGLFVLNRRGEIVQALGRDLNHRFGDATELLATAQGTIWARVGSGLLRVDFLEPLTGFVNALPYARIFPMFFTHRGRLHVLSSNVLSEIERYRGGGLKGFRRRLVDEDLPVDSALSVDEGILCSGLDTIFLLRDDDSVLPITEIPHPVLLAGLEETPDLVFAIGPTEAFVLRREGGQWRRTDHRVPSPAEAHYARHDASGNIWCEHGSGLISRVWWDGDALHLRPYGQADGLLPEWTNLWDYRGRIVISGGRGDQYLTWDAASDRLIPFPDAFVRGVYAAYPGVARPCEDNQGNLWVPTNSTHPIFRREADGSTSIDVETLRPLRNVTLVHAFAGRDGAIWLFGESTINRYDPSLAPKDTALPRTRLVQIDAPRRQEVVWRAGEPLPDRDSLVLPFRDNELLVNVTTPTIDRGQGVRHTYLLEGHSNGWTSLTGPNSLLLSNLPEGSYRLRIRAELGSRAGHEISLGFRILPPPYRTPLAYLGYLLVGCGLVALIVLLVRRSNERKNRNLQRLVAQRTRELESANRELRELMRQAEAATATRLAFLQGISHEMRTPLNAIVGPAELLPDPMSEDERSQLAMLIQSNARHLLQLVEGVLEFVENAAGVSSSQELSFDLAEMFAGLEREYAPFAEEKRVPLACEVLPGTPDFWQGDAAHVRQALRVLLDNAFKFTAAGQVRMTAEAKAMGDHPPHLLLTVADTGIGIPPEVRKGLFQPLRQGEHADGLKTAGAGIGLSILLQLLNSMKGRVELESKVEAGSTFRIELPLRPSLGGVRAPAPDSSQSA